ncbi:Aminoacylase-1-like 4, partial [Homarus americanus]
SCTEFLRGQAEELGAACQVIECVPGKPNVIMTLVGDDPTLPSFLLNSHTDVVPVFPEHWKYDPFSAHKDGEGNIYGRGTQDMKSVGIQYLEALKRLKKDGHKFLRTIHLTFVPDEEVSGGNGMGRLVETKVFREMNVGLGLDEGYSSTDNKMLVFYGERSSKAVKIKCSGQPGHGSQFLPNTAGEKLRKIINTFLDYREQQQQKLRDNPRLSLGDVTTINLTSLEGGVQPNVVPSELYVGFDVRVPPSELDHFETMVAGWCKEAGHGVSYVFDEKALDSKEMTCAEDGKNPWWDAFSDACKKENIELEKGIFPAGTDSHYVRKLGIDVLGFSPMNNTPRLLHDHNEYLNEKVFLRGIDIYATIIPALANVKSF